MAVEEREHPGKIGEAEGVVHGVVDHDVSRRRLHPDQEAETDVKVDRVVEDTDAGVLLREAIGDPGRPVGAAVVHYQDLVVFGDPLEVGNAAGEGGLDIGFLIVSGKDDGEAGSHVEGFLAASAARALKFPARSSFASRILP